MKKSFLTLCSSNRQQGYLLLELQIGILIISLVVGMFAINFKNVAISWQNMLLDTQLLTAGRYMQVTLEKEIGHQGRKIFIEELPQLGTFRIVVHIIKHNTRYTYFWKKAKLGLYRQTDTSETRGINPLYIPDCHMIAWSAEKVADDALVLRFTLEKKNRRKNFSQLILCVNGEVYKDV